MIRIHPLDHPAIEFLDRATDHAADIHHDEPFPRTYEGRAKFGTFSVRPQTVDGLACIELLAENGLARKEFDRLARDMEKGLGVAPTSPANYYGLAAGKRRYLVDIDYERVFEIVHR
ncbi:MAG TPA: hypothetical protein VJB90_04065 [Candidatus Nanoarchaeia archaeon]|nr:hypothetical protein [Candidatus Nanoarchaeia archaeon]